MDEDLSGGSAVYRTSFDVANIPEPATIVVWSLLGGLGIAISCWRRKRAG